MQTWIEYLLRFSHLVAGISWIGSSFYFIWLDGAFAPPSVPKRNVDGEVFMVHGGFYYQVEKRKIYPGELPDSLHWFKWEATLTWITGIMLFVLLYWMRGASLLIDPQVLEMSQAQAIASTLLIVLGSWFFYDLIWHPRLARYKTWSALLSVAAFVVLVSVLTQIFSGRGAYILTGAILGTQMLLNVWVRILPGQARMIADAKAGRVPDYSLSLKSKTRSVHNTYFIFPVLFIMLSNHYPSIYNHPDNGLLLVLLAFSGAMTRHAMVTRSRLGRLVLIPAAICLFLVFYFGSTPSRPLAAAFSQTTNERVEFSRIQVIIQARCLTCHGSHPTDDVYREPPKGTVLETQEQIRAKADLIHAQVIATRVMPLGNKTQMSDGERAVLESWLRQENLVP